MSDGINLITCMRFFKSMMDNATEFVKDSKKKTKSLDELKTIRSNYCQLLWMKTIMDEMNNKMNEAIDAYDQTIEPIVKNVSKIINAEDSTIYDMWNCNYYNGMIAPDELKNSWADLTEYDDVCRHIKAMKEAGYPDINNIRPIKELQSVTTKLAESQYNFVSDSKFKYYEYDTNGITISLPIIKSLDEIPPCFYYYEGTKKHSAGVYTSLINGVAMKVPSVKLIPYSMENSNYFSIKCASGKTCKNVHCTYAHPGTDYVKLGCISRCPSAHSFGNQDTLAYDIKHVKYEDARSVCMYGINDMFSAALWFNKNLVTGTKLIIDDLEVCDDYVLKNTNNKFA